MYAFQCHVLNYKIRYIYFIIGILLQNLRVKFWMPRSRRWYAIQSSAVKLKVYYDLRIKVKRKMILSKEPEKSCQIHTVKINLQIFKNMSPYLIFKGIDLKA